MSLSNSLVTHLEYHRWATELVLDEVAAQPSEQLMKPLGSSFNSLYDTIVHLYQADRIWLDRLEERPSGKLEDYAAPGCMFELREAWLDVHNRMIRFTRNLDETSINRIIVYKSLAGEPFESPIWQIILHVVNHGTYHRGQVTSMIRQLGAKPTNLDLIRFYRSNAS